MNNKRLAILGCRGIPAQHGGFETFAERFAIYLQQKGWHVTVYCQEEGNGKIYKDKWRGIYCVHIPVSHAGARGSVIFDWKSTLHAISQKHRLVLTLGYNTAIFCIFYRLAGLVNIINMDGIEWRRDKWNFGQRVWLYINERLGAWLGNHLVADHPEIKKHLAQLVSSSKISMIPYCADIVQTADVSLLAPYDLKQNKYALIVARPEKENLILEIVRAFSQVKRGIPLVILGDYSPNSNEFHKKVFDVAGSEVKFVGAIYDKDEVQALRFFARFYIHGHTVGGTNPSLVEALGAGSPILAHGNKFNRWVAGEAARYFFSEEECAQQIDLLIHNDELIAAMRQQSSYQMRCKFTCDTILQRYEELMTKMLG